MATSTADNDNFYEELEANKRLEREKKIKRKRLKEDKADKSKKHYGRQKNMKNIDWTRGYEEGLFEDDDFYDTYMR